MCQAAKAIGNTELENKFAEGGCPPVSSLQGLGVSWGEPGGPLAACG